MPLPFRVLAALAAAALLAAFSAVAQVPPADDDDDDAPVARKAPPPKLPPGELTGQMLYDFLMSEIAAQRGSTSYAAQTYLELAQRTRDPRVARRAYEVANFARLPEAALQAARIWHEVDPGSPQAMQAVTVLLVNQKRVAEAEPVLAKLLGAAPTIAENLFPQLARLLAANPDAAANLGVVRRLAEKYPKLPEARLAVAQAAIAANDEALALAEIRQAGVLKPDWDVAPLYEAQLLQRRSPGDAAKRLATYLDKNPGSRDVRLSYARLLAMDKRYPEARAEFEKILSQHKNDTDAIYAVGLLAFQVKEYGIAEANMKRLLDLGYRDANAVRFTLGQIAEEQKDWPVAIDWYKSIQRGEHALPARLRIAGAIAKQGKLEEARAFLKNVGAAALGEQQQVQVLVAESQLLREANMHKEAFQLLGDALAKTPDQPDLLYDHALTAEKVERFDVLEANLKRLIKLRPDHAHAYNALGYSFADRNLHLPEAKQLIEKALELSPQDFFIIDSLGWVLYRMGDLKGAAAQLRRAWSGRPDGEIGAHLGEVLWMLGERDEARRIWRDAQKASPDNETLRKTLKRFNP